MKSKLVNDSPAIYVLVLDSGNEVMSAITSFATEHNINAASISAIGAFSEAELGYFDFSVKDYKKIPVKEQVEVLSLIGDIVLYQGETRLHVHAVLGRSDGTTLGGHLLKAYVKPTLEVVLTELPTYLHREMDAESNIPLIKL